MEGSTVGSLTILERLQGCVFRLGSRSRNGIESGALPSGRHYVGEYISCSLCLNRNDICLKRRSRVCDFDPCIDRALMTTTKSQSRLLPRREVTRVGNFRNYTQCGTLTSQCTTLSSSPSSGIYMHSQEGISRRASIVSDLASCTASHA